MLTKKRPVSARYSESARIRVRNEFARSSLVFASEGNYRAVLRNRLFLTLLFQTDTESLLKFGDGFGIGGLSAATILRTPQNLAAN
jgi:hypothetical protein